MTTSPSAEADASSDTAPGRLWRRHRVWIVVAVAFAVAVGISAWVGGDGTEYDDPYDPENPGPQGAQAVARVLADEDVTVTIARSAAALEDESVDADTTVVVTGTERLSDSTTERLLEHASPGHLVLVEPGPGVLDHVDTAAAPRDVAVDATAAGCAPYDGLEVSVDRALAWGEEVDGCFTTAGGPLLTDLGPQAEAFGAGEALTNDQVLRADNAAVALRLLGQQPELIWYLPSYDDAAPDETVGLGSLLPDWILPSLWLALLAGGALVWWRGRRLGPLSTEPLPVVVRAVETARSRGRMYRRSNDRGHAARALRAATRRRAAERLHLGRHADETVIITAVAAHLHRGFAETQALLGSGAPPPDTDDDLVRLADELARIERFGEWTPERPGSATPPPTAAGGSEPNPSNTER